MRTLNSLKLSGAGSQVIGMKLFTKINTPLGVALMVQKLYGNHYPLLYQPHFMFVYRNKILQLEHTRMKYPALGFFPPLISFISGLVCTAGIYSLNKY